MISLHTTELQIIDLAKIPLRNCQIFERGEGYNTPGMGITNYTSSVVSAKEKGNGLYRFRPLLNINHRNKNILIINFYFYTPGAANIAMKRLGLEDQLLIHKFIKRYDKTTYLALTYELSIYNLPCMLKGYKEYLLQFEN